MEHPLSRCDTSESIINATLKIIGEEGFQNVTIRKIAALAGVNVAAINYHFGTKDIVINEALKYLTGKLMKSFNLLKEKELSPKTRMQNFIRSYADAALEHPDVFRNYINHSMCNSEMPSDFSEFIKREGFEELKNTLREISSENDEIKLFMKSFQIISGVAFPVLLGKQMEKLSGIDYADEGIRYKYLEVLLKTIVEE